MRISSSALITALVLISSFSSAQIVINNNITLDEAITNLLGPGVTYSNVTFSGIDHQRGTFNGTNSNVGINTGLVLGTGDVAFAVGPNNQSGGSLGGGAFRDSDPDLDELDGLTHNDAAILEFDFVATGQTVTFTYVWASDEYPEYSGAGTNCANISDVFGFFLSGPGIIGPFTDNAINIALIPGTTQFVSIANLNAGCTGLEEVGDEFCNNCEFYIHNGNGNEAPFNSGNYIQYDGLTIPMQATYTGLVCYATYHIKLAIADVSDTGFDSAVFFEQGSFGISGDFITPVTDNANGLFPEVTIVEGCIPGQFVIVPPCVTEDITLDLNYTGTAIIGDDYTTNFQTTLTLEPGIDEYIIEITPLDDDLQEGPETITLSFSFTIAGQPELFSATVFMQDYDDNEPFISDIPSSFICPDEVVTITPVPNQGYPPYTYTWSTGATGPQQSFTGGSEGTYEVTLTDLCDYTWTEVFQIFEPDTFRTDTFDICLGDIGVLALGGLAPYEFNFNTAGIVAEEDNSTYRGLIFGSTLFTVTDGCGQVRAGALNVITCQIPNVFTPNGDGKNEFFEIQGINAYPNSKLQVWNRWGVLVYESENYENFWSAEEQPDGTYFYLLQRSDGEIVTGEITILR